MKAAATPAAPQAKFAGVRPSLGCDPELFIEQDGKVVGSELVIPDAGLEGGVYSYSHSSKVIQDGVQVELNPAPSTCRESMMFGLVQAFFTLDTQLKKMKGMKASFNSVIEMDPAELEKLSEKSKRLGCAPSKNAYDKNATIKVDATTYMKRSAGGHLHFGIATYPGLQGIDPNRVARVLDVMVGNQSVLMDRDPNAAERRKVYGRAGEHRTPPYGFEYRTLSNFWLRSVPLCSGVFGMARQGLSLLAGANLYKDHKTSAYTGLPLADFEAELFKLVDADAVREAINSNDFALAKENWKGVKQFIQTFAPENSTGLNLGNVNAFEYFVHMIDQKGITHWFPEDPLAHWVGMKSKADGRAVIGRGWESFLRDTVSPQMSQDKKWKSL